MSADLLRRAAAVLRQHAEQAVDSLTEGAPWTVEYWPAVLDDDQPGLTVIARRNNLCSYITGVALTDSHTRYIALMHPPVALALADLLDAVAQNMERDFTCTRTADEFSPPVAAVARAILRELQS